jgi:hypothetical protein
VRDYYANQYWNATSKAKLPLQLWLVDFVLQQNVCPLGHKMQRQDLFLTALYAFHKGYWCSIPDIIWRQLHKFWEGVHLRAVEGTKTWGLPFPFLSTYILRKKGIKGTLADGPITDHPQFGQIQWNQSYSYMPWEHWVRAAGQERAADGAKLMDMEEEEADEEVAEEEETITVDAAHYRAIQ